MGKSLPTRKGAKKAEDELRAYALSMPEVVEEFPWGHSAFKVNKKVFLFMSNEDGGLSLSTKLPDSSTAALNLPFAKPTGYGLGKAGWISSSFAAGEKPPQELLRAWIVESYRAVAPKKLSARLDAAPVAPAKPKKKAAKKKARRA
jgi:predicted DNA-binding protein (MmcQ/YjbR family)